MANKDIAFGFVPVGTTDGSDYHGKMMEVEFAAADAVPCHLGDMVKLTGTNGTDGTIPVVARADAGDALLGAIVEFYPDFENENYLNQGLYRAASTARKARVVYGKDVIYKAQASTTLATASAGQNADIVVGTGSNITGQSGSELAAATGAGATAQMRLLRVSKDVGNAIGADAVWECTINEDQLTKGTGV